MYKIVVCLVMKLKIKSINIKNYNEKIKKKLYLLTACSPVERDFWLQVQVFYNQKRLKLKQEKKTIGKKNKKKNNNKEVLTRDHLKGK